MKFKRVDKGFRSFDLGDIFNITDEGGTRGVGDSLVVYCGSVHGDIQFMGVEFNEEGIPLIRSYLIPINEFSSGDNGSLFNCLGKRGSFVYRPSAFGYKEVLARVEESGLLEIENHVRSKEAEGWDWSSMGFSSKLAS